MSGHGMIAIDWGTSSLRAARLSDAGFIVAQISGGPGILAVSDGTFGQTLGAFIAPLQADAAGLPIVMTGMIGSRQGWREVPYLSCPAPLAALAGALGSIADHRLGTLYIVPGVSVERAGHAPDVMRGEETQIVGALDWLGKNDGVFVLPGTHSKWVEVCGGRLETFATYMTGEIFASLCQHTILGRLMPPAGAIKGDAPQDKNAYRDGIHAGAQDGHPGHLLNRVFAARTLGLFERVPASGLASYLSGVLIGAEMAAAVKSSNAANRFVIVGSAPALTDLYLAAASHLGCDAEVAPADCAARGAFRLAVSAGLLRGNARTATSEFALAQVANSV